LGAEKGAAAGTKTELRGFLPPKREGRFRLEEEFLGLRGGCIGKNV
jgi:hypothetical protein